eukprot:5332697-Amphidinium_carterae.1
MPGRLDPQDHRHRRRKGLMEEFVADREVDTLARHRHMKRKAEKLKVSPDKVPSSQRAQRAMSVAIDPAFTDHHRRMRRECLEEPPTDIRIEHPRTKERPRPVTLDPRSWDGRGTRRERMDEASPARLAVSDVGQKAGSRNNAWSEEAGQEGGASFVRCFLPATLPYESHGIWAAAENAARWRREELGIQIESPGTSEFVFFPPPLRSFEELGVLPTYVLNAMAANGIKDWSNF